MNDFQIEIISMDLQICKTFCSNCLPSQEQQQEQFARQSITRHIAPPTDIKQVYSFKLQSHRQLQLSDKNFHLQPTDRRMIRMRSVEMRPSANYRQSMVSRSPPAIRFYSPYRKEETSLRTAPRLEALQKNYTLKSIIQPRVVLQPKVAFHFSTPAPPSPPANKMADKRLKTNQEETEYSTKHSQVIFKSVFDMPDNSSWVTFQKSKEGNNQVSFKESGEPSLQESLQTISEHMPSSQQNSHSPTHLEYYRSGATMQTIVTSTEIKSRNSSRFSNHFHLLRDAREEKEDKQGKETKRAPQLSFDVQMNNNYSIAASPKAYLSPRNEHGLPNDPHLFQNSAPQNISPRISVLSLSEHHQNKLQEQEELRDVIDHNFLVSPHCSHNNSAKVSLVPSLKNVSDHENSEKYWRRSPLHSRQSSWELGLLMAARAKFQRTNTIDSIESFSSEMISCLDIKFMQKNKGRREVSRLL